MAGLFKNSRLKPICFLMHNAKKKRKLKATQKPLLRRARENMNRIEALKEAAAEHGFSGTFLIFNQFNLIYFTGFSGGAALLIPEAGENVLYVAGVNYEQAKVEAKGITVEHWKRGENLMEKIAGHEPSKKYAVDTLPIESWQGFAKIVGGEEKLEPIGNLILKLRSVKDEQEIQLIREACNLASVGMEVASEVVQPGVKEKDVAAEVEYAMRKKGSDGTSFDTIIASGGSSAYPHG